MKPFYLTASLLVVLLASVKAEITTLSTATSFSVSYQTVEHTITLKNVYTITLPDGKLTTSTEITPTPPPTSPTSVIESTSRTAGGVYAEATTITKTIEGCSVTANVDCKTTITSTNMVTMTTTILPVTGTSTATNCPPGGTGVADCQTRTETFTTSTTKLIPVNTVTKVTDSTTIVTEIASSSATTPSSSTERTSSSATSDTSSTLELTPTPSSSSSVESTQTSLSSTSNLGATPPLSSIASSTSNSNTNSNSSPTSTSIQIPTSISSTSMDIPIASTASATTLPVTDLCGEKYTFAGAVPTGLVFENGMTVIAGGTMYSVPSGRLVVGAATGLAIDPSPAPDTPRLKRSRFWAM